MFLITFLKAKLRRFSWLTTFYRKYILRLPFDGQYPAIINQQERYLNDLVLKSELTKFSIIVPVYCPDLALFEEMVNSVLEQNYTNWELILVDDASNHGALSAYLESLKKIQNVQVVIRSTNGHISLASNDALAVATGDFILLLDQDDLLHKNALICCARYIDKYPHARIFYSDEDKLNNRGERHTPHFKPAWSPDLLFSHNYVSHLGVYQRSLIEQISGFRVGYEGSQDYDLLLRCLDYTNNEEIIHIPYVLYHWRALNGSTALRESEKNYTQNAGLSALRDHFSGKGCRVAFGDLPNTYRIHWPLPEPPPLVSIIIPTKNAHGLVKQCIDSIREKTSYSNYEIILVDNNSDDISAQVYFKRLSSEGVVQLIHYSKPFNFSAINNYAAKKANGSILVLMNNDIEIMSPEWLSEMVSHVSRQEIGCVGAKLYYPDGTLQHAGVIGGLGGVAGHSHKHFRGDHSGYFKRLKVVQNLSAVTAACLAVRASVFEEVNGLNEESLAVAFNDVEFCLKVRKAGYRNLWSPYIEMIHHESISRGPEDTPEKQLRFSKEVEYMKNNWGDELMHDPYYSQWLTLDREDFTLR